MQVKITRLSDIAKMPVYGSQHSAGADIFAAIDAPIDIQPGETAFISTGFALEIPEGYVGLIYARSGLACKNGLAPANKVGVIDSDYRGEVKVALYNHSQNTQTVDVGERIAQLVVAPYLKCEFAESADLSPTGRGDGGFGSTGR